MTPDTQIRIIAGTNIGLIRKKNEDNFILNPDNSLSDWFMPTDVSKPIKLGNVGCTIAVADGMGGANCGEVASALTVECVKNAFESADLPNIIQSDLAIIDFLKRIVLTADLTIKQYAADHPESKGMGTTLVLGWLLGRVMHIVWCGDSRVYVYHPQRGLRRLSKDHSRVQSYIDQGLLTEDTAFGHPESNIITRCIGDVPKTADADYFLYEVQPSDTFLFCTDGLSAYCPDEEISQVMEETCSQLNTCRNELINHALQAGGYDNVTVALLSVE